jgi:hypothetical protein
MADMAGGNGLAFAHARLGLPGEAGAQIWGIKGSGVASAQVLDESWCPRRRTNPSHNGKNFAMELCDGPNSIKLIVVVWE